MTIQILGQVCALSRELDRMCAQIAVLNPLEQGAVMLAQIRKARPDFMVQYESDCKAKKIDHKTVELALNAFGSAIIDMWVKEIPSLVDEIIARIDDPAATPALRCGLVSALAYVVQPRDLVPDDAPGGYGFLDDTVLLIACLLQATADTKENESEIATRRKKLAGLQSALPANVNTGLEQAMQGLVLLVQSMNMLPAQIADASTRLLLDNPGIATAPQAPSGWQVPSFLPVGAGHWSGGAYFEGGNVVIPGGPSLIDGKVFIPD